MISKTQLTYQDLLNSTSKILYETHYEEFPYALSGTCFPIRWKNTLYLVSALHCFTNHIADPQDLLYEIPTKPRNYFGFDRIIKIDEDEKYADLVIIRVANKVHTQDQIDSVVALDLCNLNSLVSIDSDDIKDVILRGFITKLDGNIIDYDMGEIKTQAYVTNKLICHRNSEFEHCAYIELFTPFPAGMSADGMSGTPVYATSFNNLKLSGIVIEFNSLSNEYLIIDVGVLYNLLKKEHNVK